MNWVSNCFINCRRGCVKVPSVDVDGSFVGVVSVCVDIEGVDCSYVCLCSVLKCCSYQPSVIIIHHTLLIFLNIIITQHPIQSPSPQLHLPKSHPNTHSQHQQHVYKTSSTYLLLCAQNSTSQPPSSCSLCYVWLRSPSLKPTLAQWD